MGRRLMDATVRPGQVPIIGLAHGSRHADVAASLDELMAAVAGQGRLLARAAFLDLTEPDLDQVATELAVEGFRRAVVVPLLFTMAFHATIDAPETVREAADRAGVQLTVAEILGTGPDVLDLIHGGAARAGIGPASSILLYAVGSSRPGANEAVHDLARRLADLRGRPALAAFGTMDPKPEAVIPLLPEPIGVLPLFLSPGLLLEPMARLAAEQGWPIAEPIGTAAAPLVLDRYRAALTAAGWLDNLGRPASTTS
jgi:sirohydrochlorin cobaltochelatase